MLIGAHVSSSGGVKNALTRAFELNVQYLQTFLSAPQSYKVSDISDEKVQEFLKTKEELNILECYAHAIYLLNFASEKPQNVHLSKENLITTLNLSAKLRFNGVIIHMGSTKDTIENGVKAVGEKLKEVLENTDPGSTLYLENSAGAGNLIGSDLDHLVEVIEINKGNPRIKVCIDTQHAFVSGLDIRSDPLGAADKIFSTLGYIFKFIHLNYTKTDFNTKRDRHENIGEGLLGLQALKTFCLDSRIQKIVKILEVPGFEKKGPDKENIEIVRSFEN
jgi:apurinic endonuclease APN1